MPLTVRTNGSTSVNIISASWFNDYYNLLTGAMQDQEVTIKNVLILQAIGGAPSSAPTGSLASGTSLGIGNYVYAYTYANADGETTISPTASITTTSGNQKVNLSNISVGPTGTTARKIYRTAVGGGTSYKLLATINDNTTTTYTDTTADASLGVANPASPTFGGALIIKDQTGTVKFKINNDGSFSSGGTTGFGNTTINGTLTVTGQSTLQGLVILSLGRFGKSASGDLFDGNGNDTYIKGTAGVHFQIPNGTNIVNITSTGLNVATGSVTVSSGNVDVTGGQVINVGTLKFSDNSNVSRFNRFSGSGSVTVNHNNGVSPTWVQITTNTGATTGASQTIGYGNLTSTQVTVTAGAGYAWWGICGT